MRNKALDLVGKTSLEEVVALISKLNLLVTNDGGPLHIAVACGIKTVSIFGPVDDLVYGPYPPQDTNIVLKTDLSCRPCYKKFKMPACDKNRECISRISVDQVYDAVRRLL
jgi:ADP-heptose:LPS heptosyltransferase